MSFDWIGNCLASSSGCSVSAVEKLGLLTSKMEDWRYTNVRELFAGDWSVAQVPAVKIGQALKLVATPFSEGVRLAFADGVFLGVEGVSPGVLVEVVGGQAGESMASAGQDVFGDGEEAILAICKGVAPQTVKIKIGNVKGARVEIVHLATDGHSSKVSASSVVAEVSSAATAVVFERFVNCGAGEYLRLNNTQVRVAKGGRLEWLREIREGQSAKHCGVFHSRVEEETDFRVLFKTVGGGVVRNASSVVMLGEGASVGLHGVTIADGEMCVDNSTLLDHRVGYCESRELFRGVYRGRSSGAFTGKVRVHKDAQKTNAYQQNNALMLSDTAEFNSRPVLQIWADDVKCTHGATVGAMDDDALRYMRARGLGKVEAEELLAQAFLAEVESNFSHSLP